MLEKNQAFLHMIYVDGHVVMCGFENEIHYVVLRGSFFENDVSLKFLWCRAANEWIDALIKFSWTRQIQLPYFLELVYNWCRNDAFNDA